MRDARYVRLISWTLQSGSEQFIYYLESKPTQTWTKELAKRNGQGSNRKKRMGIQVQGAIGKSAQLVIFQ